MSNQAAARSGPLRGVFVVDFTHALSGPFCTMLLADLGARVIKVERPGEGDVARHLAPLVDGTGALFRLVNRGKESVALDIENADDRREFLTLVRHADVIVENFRPGTMERHGVGYEELSKINPKLVFASLSGFGETGPDSWEGAYDTVIQAMSGLASITGMPDGPPTLVGDAVADCLAGIYTWGAIATALYARERTGVGAHIDIAMFDCLLTILQGAYCIHFGEGRTPVRAGNQMPIASPFGLFRAADGEIAICAGDDASFARLCRALPMDVGDDERFATVTSRATHADAVRVRLEAALGARPVAEWVDLLQRAGVAAGPVNSVKAAVEDPQTQARRMIIDVGPIRAAGNPVKIKGYHDPESRPAAPGLDEHGDAVRKEFGLGRRS